MHAVPVGRVRVVAVVVVVAVVAGLWMVVPGVAQDDASPPPELVVLARSDNPADALGAGPVAAILGAPVLVTVGSRLLPVTAAAIEAIDPELVVLAGGEAALSAQVEQDVAALGYATRRAAGADRHETAALLAGLLAEYQTGRPVLTGVAVTDAVIPGLNAEQLGGMSLAQVLDEIEEGPQGPEGPEGPEGPAGPEGPEGPAGPRTALSSEQLATLSWWEDPPRPATVAVGSNPIGMAFDGAHVWVANWISGDVSKIDPATNSVVATVAVGANPSGVAFDGAHLWVANRGPDTVSKVDPAAEAVVATVTVGNDPRGVAFDGAHVWVANRGHGTVSKIDPAAEAVLATVDVGGEPFGVAFDGDNVWVANESPNTVSKLRP